MIHHSHTKHLLKHSPKYPAFRIYASVIIPAILLLLGLTVSFKLPAPEKNSTAIPSTGYVTNQQMQLAIPCQNTDDSALYSCLKKAQSGKKITAGFIGGSITKGTISAGQADHRMQESLSYVECFSRWWHKKFPDAGINIVNAGISATDSYLGVHRVQKDILSKNPDLVVVEFAVNDQMTPLYQQAYESLIRKLLTADSHPAVLLLFLSRTNGISCQFQQLQIGQRYHLPMLSYKNVMEDMLSRGTYTAEELSGDGIHPSALGCAIIGEILTKFMDGICDKKPDKIFKKSAPAEVLTDEKYKNAHVLSCSHLNIKSIGTFRPVNKSRFFPGNLECSSGSGDLEFTIACKNLGFLYVREKNGNGGQFDVYVDGRKMSEINTDNRGAHNNQPGAAPCFSSNSTDTHTVRITKNKNSTGSRLILYAVLISE